MLFNVVQRHAQSFIGPAQRLKRARGIVAVAEIVCALFLDHEQELTPAQQTQCHLRHLRHSRRRRVVRLESFLGQHFLRFVVEGVFPSKNSQHLSGAGRQGKHFFPRVNHTVTRRLRFLHQVPPVLALALAMASLHARRQKPFLAAAEKHLDAGRHQLRHDFLAGITPGHARDKNRRARFRRTATIDQPHRDPARLSFLHDTASLTRRRQWRLSLRIHPESPVRRLHPVSMHRRPRIRRRRQHILGMAAIDRRVRQPVPIDIPVRPGQHHPRHLPMRDPRSVDMIKNHTARLRLRGSRLRRRITRDTGACHHRTNHQPRGRSSHHSPISSFHSSGSSAMKSSISLMQSASCRISTSTPWERTYSSGP